MNQTPLHRRVDATTLSHGDCRADRAPSVTDQYLLGVSAFYHDSAACLLRNGEIVAAAQEERFTRRKGDPSFPSRAIDYCLAAGGIRPTDLAAAAFYDKPLLKFERILETYLGVAPRGFLSFLKAGPLWVTEKLYTDSAIRRGLGGYSGSSRHVARPRPHRADTASSRRSVRAWRAHRPNPAWSNREGVDGICAGDLACHDAHSHGDHLLPRDYSDGAGTPQARQANIEPAAFGEHILGRARADGTGVRAAAHGTTILASEPKDLWDC